MTADSPAGENTTEAQQQQQQRQRSRAEAANLSAFVAFNVLESAMSRYTDDERSTLDDSVVPPPTAASPQQWQLPPRRCRVTVLGADSSLGHYLVREAMLRYNCHVTAFARNRAAAMVNLHYLTNPHFHQEELKKRGYTVLDREGLYELAQRRRGELQLVDADLVHNDDVVRRAIKGADAVFYAVTTRAKFMEVLLGPQATGRKIMMGPNAASSNRVVTSTLQTQYSPFTMDYEVPLHAMQLTQQTDGHFVYFSTQRSRRWFGGGMFNFFLIDSLSQMKRKRQFEDAALQPYDWRSAHNSAHGNVDGDKDALQTSARHWLSEKTCNRWFGRTYDPATGGFPDSRSKITIFRPYELTNSGNWAGLGLAKRVQLLSNDYSGGVISSLDGSICSNSGTASSPSAEYPVASGASTGDLAMKRNPPRLSRAASQYSSLSYEMMAVLAMRSVLLYPRVVENSAIDVYCDGIPSERRPTLQELDKQIAELP